MCDLSEVIYIESRPGRVLEYEVDDLGVPTILTGDFPDDDPSSFAIGLRGLSYAPYYCQGCADVFLDWQDVRYHIEDDDDDDDGGAHTEGWQWTFSTG